MYTKNIRNFEPILVERRVLYLPIIEMHYYWHLNIYLHTLVPFPKVQFDSSISFANF